MSITVPTQADVERRRESLIWAIGLLDEGRADLAERELLWITSTFPRDVEALRLLARAQAALDHAGNLRLTLERIVREDPEDFFAHVVLGELALDDNRPNDAEVCLRAALELDPIDSDALELLARSQIARDLFDDARDTLEGLLLSNREYLYAHLLLGSLHMDADRRVESEESFREALRLDPANPDALDLFSRVLIAMERAEEASVFLEQLLEIDPERADAHLMVGGLAMDDGQFDEAEEFLGNALRLAPDSVDALNAYAMLKAKVGNREEAERFFRRALSIDPGNAEAQGLLAVLLAELGDPEAVPAARRAVELAREDPRLRAQLGAICLQEGKPFEARAQLLQALRLDASNEEFQKAYEEADHCCHWSSLPVYFLRQMCRRLTRRVPA